MKKNLIFLALIHVLAVRAQDIHFSQFYLNPTLLNPALTGVFSQDLRLSTDYRNQWSPVLGAASYQTGTVSGDIRMNIGGGNDFFGFGINLFTDKAGTASFGQQQANVGLSFAKNLKEFKKNQPYGHYLVFGATLGFGQWSVDGTAVSFGSQYRRDGTFDPTLPSPSAGLTRWQQQFLDFSAGGTWFAKFGDHKSIYIGAAAHHLNRPPVSFLGDQGVLLETRYTLHGGAEFYDEKSFSWLPNLVLIRQNQFLEINSGLSGRFYFRKSKDEENYFSIGAWWRIAQKPTRRMLSDAAIIAIQLGMKNTTIGLSYDINTSPLARANAANNAIELALVYQLKTGWNKNKVECPVF